ncbi:MAG: SusC/RagA family TonB-linked outer membrane protein [Bacteroidales bacterium]|nr:SusC/RagA family TonB-linked outer membrane protein [Bacteroidales bacterium]
MNKTQLFKRLAALAVGFFLSLPLLLAQNRVVKGTVLDDTDQGVIGAAVMIKGTTNGVATDVDGKFEISCDPADVLVISSIGFDDVEVAVGNRTELTIRLEISQELLDDVVVIGYGTTRAKNFTGSVDVIKMSDSPVADLGLSNAADMLRGRLSGVDMGAESATVGSNANIMVRGRKSINSTSSAPLLVVNGVIFTGNLEDIDQNSIESISVLKDATSLAAYGSKAANGVIMITLKKGEEGKPLITFSTSHQFSTPSYRQRFLSPENYIKYSNARRGIEDLTNTSWMSFLEKANYEKGRTTDWYNMVTRMGYTQNYNLSFSGRTQNSNYYVALGHSGQRGIVVGNDFSRNNVSMNLSTHIFKNIEIGANMAYTNSVDNHVAASTNVNQSPYMEPYLPDGKTLRYYVEGVNASSVNPLWETQVGREKDNRRFNLNLGGFVSVNIPWVEGLNLRMNASYTKMQSNNYSFTHENITPALLSNDWEGIGQTSDYYNLANAEGSISNSVSENWVMDFILSYARQFGRHYVSASLVYTRDSAESSYYSEGGKGFMAAGNTLTGWYGLGNADTKTVSNPTYVLHTDVGYLARVIYSYRDTYHFNASFRRDGSSVFGNERKWGNFPAVGAAWTMSNEQFMKDNVHWIDFLKLKLSWGKNGAQTISPYGTLSTIAVAKGGGIPNYYGGETHWGQRLATLGNPTLGWQTTTSWNGGFEADFLQGRIHIDVNAYFSQTTDQIFDRNIPVMTAGITTQKATMGRVDNNGVEVNLNTVNIKKKNFEWSSNWVFSLNRNRIIDLYGDGQDDLTKSLFIGHPINTIYGYKTEGIFQDGQNAGRPIFYTLDGQQTDNPSPEDRQILGSGDENFRLSWANTLRWGNWQVYLMFQGVFGGAGFGLANNTFAYSTYDMTASCTALDIPFWTRQAPNNTYPAPNVSESKYAVYNSYGHVRLQDLSVSYNLSKLVNKIGLKGARVTLAGRNLFFIAPGWKMSDPQSRSAYGVGIPRSVTLGLNVSF